MQQASATGLDVLRVRSPKEELKEELKNQLKEIRAGFTRQGTSLNAYLKEHKIHQGNVYKAFDGSWNGKKAQELRNRLAKAANIG